MNNWLDIGIAVGIVVLVLAGLRSGLIGLITKVLGTIVGGLLAWNFSPVVGNLLEEYITNDVLAQIVGFGIIFAIVVAIFTAGGSAIRKVLSLFLLGWVDRGAGAIVALVVGVLIAGGLVQLLSYVPLDVAERAVAESSLAPRVTYGLDLAVRNIASDLDPSALRQKAPYLLSSELQGLIEDPRLSEEVSNAVKRALEESGTSVMEKLKESVSPEEFLDLRVRLLGDDATKDITELLEEPDSSRLTELLGEGYKERLKGIEESLDDSSLLDLLTEGKPVFKESGQE